MGKNALRSKVDGNELDLCFSELKEVPVKELAAIPKATHIDLSQNFLTSLPPSFCSLTHLVKLDLGKNLIIELPPNFGNLENLQHLDLYSNKLKVLPESFYKLERLKFLDLKNNPLDARLAAVAGDCLDEKQCQLCAKKVVEFMAKIHDELEKQREKKDKLDKDKEAKKLAAAEKAKEKQRLAKKAAKEKRKEEMRLKNLDEMKMGKKEGTGNVASDRMQNNNNFKTTMKNKQAVKQGSRSILKWALALTTVIFGVMALGYYVKQPERTLRVIDSSKAAIAEYASRYSLIFTEYFRDYSKIATEHGLKYSIIVSEYTLEYSKIISEHVVKYSKIVGSAASSWYDLGYKFANEKVEDVMMWLRENKYL